MSAARHPDPRHPLHPPQYPDAHSNPEGTEPAHPESSPQSQRAAIHPTVDPYYAPATVPKTHGQLRVLRVGDVALDLDGHRVHVAGRPVETTHKEFLLLHTLMENAGRVLTGAELCTAGWGEPSRPHNDLVVYIRRIRRHIEPDPARPTRIRTVRGVGYIFDLAPDPTSPDI